MRALSTTLILLTGLVNLLPVSGVLASSRLEALYGVAIEDPNVVILLRHRAVLFGIIGGLLLVAALQVSLRPVAVAAGLTSMISFVLVAWLVGSYNPELRRVIVIDLIASFALLASLFLDRLAPGAKAPA